MIWSKRLLYIELAGFAFIFLLGGAWHFLYDWSGGNSLVGLLAPINESVWEHFKIGIYPTFLFALLSYPWVGKYRRQYWAVAALKLYLIPLIIAGTFYAYTALLGYHLLVLDITIFGISAAAAQFIGYKLLRRNAASGSWFWIGIIGIAVLLAGLAWLTFNPLPLPVFVE